MRYFFCCLFYVLLFSCSVRASLYSEISQLERETVDEALKVYGLSPVDDATGKKIDKIITYTKSPFSKEAGFLSILDVLHVNTKDAITKEYLYVQEGDIFDPALVRDSEQSLRRQGLVRSLAVIIPVREHGAKKSEGISLLVATRDLLSLRPTFDFQGNAEVITNVMVALGEHNLLGTNKSLQAIYDMRQAYHELSFKYFDPHLLGSNWEYSLRPGLIFSRYGKGLDGFFGEFCLERPLIAQTDKWGLSLNLDFASKPSIDFNGSKIRTYEITHGNRSLEVERRYRWRFGKAKMQVKRSFGSTYKIEPFIGYGLYLKRPSIEKDMNLVGDDAALFKKNVLPKNELESYFVLGISYFHNQYLTLYDYNNFKLAETKRLGPSITLSADFSSKMLFLSDQDFIRPESKITYTMPFGKDAFGIITFSSSNRFDGALSDNTFKYGFSLVSPKKLWGRAILDARLSTAEDNRDNQTFSLGADTGIRGVKSGFYKDSKALRANLEWRSNPLDIWIFHVGMALFYDIGSAFKKWEQINATHTLGLGIRILTPQVSSQLFRFDLGFPIYGPGQRQHIVVPSFGIGQAF